MPEMMRDQRRAERHATALREWLARPVAGDPDPVYETEWRIEVFVEPPELDPETGEVVFAEQVTAKAYDLNHHSNVLFATFEQGVVTSVM